MIGWSSICAAGVGLLVGVTAGAQQATTAAAAQSQTQGVPNVVGLSLDSARRILSVNKLLPRVEAKPDGSRAAATDIVAQQRPQAGQGVPFGRIVSLSLRVTDNSDGQTNNASTQQQLVPYIVGLTLDSAQRLLARRKLQMRITTSPGGISTLPQDVISRQSPLARQPVPSNRVVNAEVAPNVIQVPNVIGLTIRPARTQLAGFDVRVQLAPNSATRNTIFRQDPAPSTYVRPATPVTIYIAQAIEPAQRVVPNVVGRQLQDAKNILAQAGFQAGRVSDDDDANVEAGAVVTQNPRDGLRVEQGTLVDLSVRSNRVRVPAVISLTEADARQQLTASGLHLGAVELREDSATTGTVIGQSLAARTLVDRGSDIMIVVARPITPAAAPQTPIVPPPRDPTPAPTPAPVTPAPTTTPGIVVPDVVGLPRSQAQAVAARAGFMFVVAPGQSARDVDTVVKQFPAARSTATAGSLVLMAEFNPMITTTRPWWIVWVALAIPIIAAAGALIKNKLRTPQQVAFPPITYTAGAKPPTFSIQERRSTHGLDLSLCVKNDPGMQAVSPRNVHAG